MAHLMKNAVKRSASVISVSPVTVVEIDPDLLWLASVGCREKFSRAFVEMLVERLAVSDSRLANLLEQSKAGVMPRSEGLAAVAA
jgi:CRP-like cAMP-binding protein